MLAGNWKHWSTQPLRYKQHEVVFYWYFLKKLQTGRKEAKILDFVLPTLWSKWPNQLLFCGYNVALWCLSHLTHNSTMKSYSDFGSPFKVKMQKVRLGKEISILLLKPLCWKSFRLIRGCYSTRVAFSIFQMHPAARKYALLLTQT